MQQGRPYVASGAVLPDPARPGGGVRLPAVPSCRWAEAGETHA